MSVKKMKKILKRKMRNKYFKKLVSASANMAGSSTGHKGLGCENLRPKTIRNIRRENPVSSLSI
jgi:hypothetical protein